MKVACFLAVRYTRFCSGANGGRHHKKGIHGVGLTVKRVHRGRVDKGGFAAECISAARLIKVRV